MPQVEIRADIWGKDRLPHTFINVYDSNGNKTEYGFVPLNGRLLDVGHIDINKRHESDRGSGLINITDEQYTNLMIYINNSILNPPDYKFFIGQHCTNWVNNGLIAAGITLPTGAHNFVNSLTNNPYAQWFTFAIKDALSDGDPDPMAPWIDIISTASTVRWKDPLILDLDGDGVETINVKDGAYFDHDGNGFAEQTGWVSSDDGILTLDRNSDGIINDGTELFGDQTTLQNGQKATDGFQALAELDSNADGIIDINDTQFSQLKVWQDLDGDGYSASDELFTLQEMGIASINVAHTDTNILDPNGNTQVQTGTFTKADGSTAAIGGFNLRRDATYTIADDWLDVPDNIASLPDLQGYGNTYDLHQAIVRDTTGTLKSLIEQFVASDDSTVRDALMEQILFKWTGSDAIDPDSRGTNFDARQLAVIETLLGQPFVGANGPDPNSLAAPLLTHKRLKMKSPRENRRELNKL